MMNRILCVLLLAAAFISCRKESGSTSRPNSNNTVEYLIPKGAHYATQNAYVSTHLKELRFSAKFDSSCIYTTSKSSNTDDVNKLFGFSDCNTAHHLNSARFGWRWTGQSLEILAYCYADGEREIKSMGSIQIGKDAEMSIKVTSSTYIFKLGESVVTMKRHCDSEFAEGYQLYPYFGGDEVAPHDIRIWIRY